MNKFNVNKGFVSKLAWQELDSEERTAAMELVRAIDELRVNKMHKENPTLKTLLVEFRKGIKDNE